MLRILSENRISLTRYCLAVAVSCWAIGVAALPTARAAELADQVRSLGKVPVDAAFYSASLRLEEQWNIFLDSKAYQKLMEIPVFQLGRMQLMYQLQQSPHPAIAQFREYYESPAGQDAAALLKEMFSEEFFVYGGNDVAELFKLLMEFNSINRSARLEALAQGKDEEEVLAVKFLKRIEQAFDEGLSVPTLVAGFRVKDTSLAKRELNEIHTLLRGLLDENQPGLAAQLQREQVGGHDFLTFRLDGSMIPWDLLEKEINKSGEAEDTEANVETEAVEEGDGSASEDSEVDGSEDAPAEGSISRVVEEFKALRKAISKQSIVVALGVTEEYVVFSVGSSTAHIEKLGQGTPLAKHPALVRLQKHAEERIVGVSYLSKAFASSLGSPQQTVEDLANTLDEALATSPLGEEDRRAIVEDIRALDFSKLMPEPGEQSGIVFLTSRGYEGFKYATSGQPLMDSSKPLTILNHVGGNPALLVASRSKNDLGDYDKLVGWLKRFGGHLEAIAKKEASAEDWAKYEQYRSRGIELLEKLDRANREQLFPGMTDGQSAFVLDFAAESPQWFLEMPEADKPLPMIEMAMVSAVSDVEKFRAGVQTYLDVFEEGYAMVKEIDPNTPDFKLPLPEVSEMSAGGKLYSYALPVEWGLDPQVAPNAGLTDSLLVLSGMPLTTERLLQENPLSIDTSLKLDRPACMIVHLQFSKFFETARPWIDYGISASMGSLKSMQAAGDETEEGSGNETRRAPQSAMAMQLGMIVPQVEQLLEVFETLRSTTAIVYEEDGLWITHSETHIRDVP
ncbi:MAG: hypothetical protein IT425_02830 [Pirellulales bacterium]|nr:hypothetical protein [Pirellulales bacterium]